MAECQPSEVLRDAKCFTNLEPRQMGAVTAALLCRILLSVDPMATCDTTELMSAGKCFLCLEPKQQMAIQLQLLCNIAASIGGGTGTGVACGIVDPTVDPGVACQLWVNTAKGWLWNWDDAFGVWRPLISA